MANRLWRWTVSCPPLLLTCTLVFRGLCNQSGQIPEKPLLGFVPLSRVADAPGDGRSVKERSREGANRLYGLNGIRQQS